MALRIVVGLLLAAVLSACSGGGNGLAGSNTTGGGTATASSSGTVTASPITLQGVPANTATVGNNYLFQPSASSSSGVVTFAIEGQPSWATFDMSTGTLSGTPSSSDVGLTPDITIIASNGGDTGSVGPFTIRVSPSMPGGGDAPPTIEGTPAATVSAGQSYTFEPQASDAAGKPLTFAISNGPSWAMFDTATGRLSGTPNGAQVGNYTNIDISVSDGSTSVALPMFSIAVTPSNPAAPSISGTPQTLIAAGQSYSFQPSATDPASKTLTFSITQLPFWATFSTTTGKLSGTPTANQEGPYPNIVISVSDGSASVSLNPFTITVAQPGAVAGPVIGGTPVTSASVGVGYSFQPTASDPAGKTLTFSIVNRPTWASFNAASGQLTGTPSNADAGSYPNILISVSDGTSSAVLPAFSIVVSRPATAGSPTISGSPELSVLAGSAYSFTPSTTDPSGGKLTFSIKNAPSWASFNTATGELSGTPTAAEVGTYSNIGISVSDGRTSVSLPAFPIVVTQDATGSVTLDWVAPTSNTNGTPLTDLAGYWIYYGTSANALTQTVQVANPGILTYVLNNLTPGTWYFAVTAYTSANVQSNQSAVANQTVH